MYNIKDALSGVTRKDFIDAIVIFGTMAFVVYVAFIMTGGN